MRWWVLIGASLSLIGCAGELAAPRTTRVRADQTFTFYSGAEFDSCRALRGSASKSDGACEYRAPNAFGSDQIGFFKNSKQVWVEYVAVTP